MGLRSAAPWRDEFRGCFPVTLRGAEIGWTSCLQVHSPCHGEGRSSGVRFGFASLNDPPDFEALADAGLIGKMDGLDRLPNLTANTRAESGKEQAVSAEPVDASDADWDRGACKHDSRSWSCVLAAFLARHFHSSYLSGHKDFWPSCFTLLPAPELAFLGRTLASRRGLPRKLAGSCTLFTA